MTTCACGEAPLGVHPDGTVAGCVRIESCVPVASGIGPESAAAWVFLAILALVWLVAGIAYLWRGRPT